MIYWETNQAEIEERLRFIISHADKVVDKKFRSADYYLKLGCGFDIETSKIPLEDIEVAICYHWQFGIEDFRSNTNSLTIGGRSLSTMLEFMRLLELLASARNSRLLILDANLNYEFQFCKHYWKKIGINNKDFFAKDIRQPLKILVGESLFFTEVLGLFGTSLENIAENYCTIRKLKGDLNHDLTRNSITKLKPKEIKYCENDVEILVQLGIYIFNHYFGKNGKLPLTAISKIRDKIKKKYGKNLHHQKEIIKEWMCEEEDYTILRNYLFKGGICGTNTHFMNEELKNIVISADYTSDYPAKCFHYRFPMGKCKRIIPTIENIIFAIEHDKPYILKIEFHDLKSTTTHSLISNHKCLNSKEFNSQNSIIDNGRLFSADKAVLILNDIELLSFGFFNETDRTAYTFDRSKTKILQMWEFDYYAPLPDEVLDVIEEEYRKKATLKKDVKKYEKQIKSNSLSIPYDKWLNLKIDYQDSKSGVNGIFGMMCTALYMDILEFDGDCINNSKDEDGYIINKSYDSAISNLFLYPFWGFWITSYARMVLIDTIIRYPDIIVQYDTDSIYFINDGSQQCKELKEYIKRFNKTTEEQNFQIFGRDEIFKDLGCWDIDETPYINFKGLGSKRYMYETNDGIHATVSGCRSVNVVEYNGKLIDEMSFHILADEEKMNEEEIKLILSTKKKISSIEYQYRNEKPDCTIFEYFEDGMNIKKEYASKLASKYIELDEIIEKCPSLKTEVTDYNGDICEMEVSSCIVLTPVGYNMGINDEHELLYTMIQAFIKNHPNSDLLDNPDLFNLLKIEMKKSKK